jgi:putative phosphoribosyl transferase
VDALTRPFIDRREAGGVLAQQLRHYAYRPDVVVLALPPGGVPVAYEVATVLGVPLDIFAVRKLGVPGRPELAMGAIASGGVRVLNTDIVDWFGITERTLDVVAQAEHRELERRDEIYRKTRKAADLSGRVAILVDDGLATGATMQAAVQAVRRLAARVVVAAPVGGRDVCEKFTQIADEVICARQPAKFTSVARSYINFAETSDEEVDELLNRARLTHAALQP